MALRQGRFRGSYPPGTVPEEGSLYCGVWSGDLKVVKQFPCGDLKLRSSKSWLGPEHMVFSQVCIPYGGPLDAEVYFLHGCMVPWISMLSSYEL